MPMGAHAAPFVRRGPSSPTSFSYILVFVVVLLSTHAVVSGAADTSVQSLLKFKSALGNTEALGSWNSSTTPCSGNLGNWRGLLCYNGNVWGLQLENMHLTGQIDVDSLVPLTFLRTLSFMNNDFQGPMPDWRKLGPLKSLYLSNNSFSGEIPDDAFKGMLSLKKVHLANNNFTGNIPSSLSTPRLLELCIENNQFTGTIPDFQPGIKLLNVSHNQLEGPIPPSLRRMDLSSFLGNKGLCGEPLGTECNFSSPPYDEELSQPPTLASDPLSSPSTSSTNKPSTLKLVILIIAILVVVIAIIVMLLAYRRSKKDTPQLCQTASSYDQKDASHEHQVEDIPPPEVSGKSRKVESGKLSFVREDREKFDLQDLLRASAEVLGSGNFGSSYKAILMDGKAVVVKRFKQMNNVRREDFHEHMRRLGRLGNPNLLPLVAYYYRKEEKLLIFDHVQNGSLAGHLHGMHSADKPGLDWPTRLKIVKGVAKGLLYLHNELPSLTISHGHLKSSNVLLDKAFNPILMDYSLGPVVNPEQVPQLLLAYKSPEYSQHRRITRKTDVWCLGILILEILTGKLPANYLVQGGVGYDVNLAGWVNSIVREESAQVFDKEMKSMENSEGEMRKLLNIGAACCEEDLDKRWDLKEVGEKIDELNERDH